MRCADYLARLIADSGPMPLDRFIDICLSHPDYGYYARTDRFGPQGDFITAPEITQLFGEMMAGLLSYIWQLSGQPDSSSCQRLEAGPGRGTLFSDMDRVYQKLCPQLAASPPFFIEASPYLRGRLYERYGPDGPHFITSPHELPAQPVFGIANEFIDALGISQAVFHQGRWHWRVVDLTDGAFVFGIGQPLSADEADSYNLPPQPETGTIAEFCPQADIFIARLSRHIATYGGAFLICDYGKSDNRGDTLQAVKNHQPAPLLSSPGICDISHLVDFSSLARHAEANGARLIGPVEQGSCLIELGIAERAEQLRRPHDGENDRQLLAAIDRLTAPHQMGSIFKLALLLPAGTGLPPGFSGATGGTGTRHAR